MWCGVVWGGVAVMVQLVKKKTDQLCGLLAIAVALCPQHLEESLQQMLRDRLGDRWTRMQRGYVW